MDACVELLREEFPLIDSELFEYVTGVLECSALDFESADDVVDAVGDVLQEGSEVVKDNEDIRDVCQRMFNALHVNGLSGSGRLQSRLDTPIQLAEMAGNFASCEAKRQIVVSVRWQQVDQKKLGKAEAKLKAKQERRAERDTGRPRGPVILEEASASQASSRKDTKLEASGKNKTFDIRIENFDISFGERSLLCGAELFLVYGRRYGLIGRNGLGKTTMLKMIANRSLRVPTHISVLHVEQEVAGDDTPALQSVLESDTERESLLLRERELNKRLAAG
uniref:ABC transporter domain-containing protein n=1 Tax=Petromyzon marinus TaxID=7757 RepID=S4RWC6_PETMA